MKRDVIIALDFKDAETALSFLDKFTEEKPFVKIGMELFYAAGPSIVKEVKARGHNVFLDLKTKKPVIANKMGGFSGPAIFPVALRMVWQVSKAVSIPIIGLGGIMNATDAIEFFLAGASAIEIGTANFIDPTTALKVADGIKDYLERHGYSSVSEIVGALKVG